MHFHSIDDSKYDYTLHDVWSVVVVLRQYFLLMKLVSEDGGDASPG